ncbi:MAG: 16S rRNA (guanine(527)-N(7))-methyltransferase RsmG [Rhodospirillales bacterium]|nr:16S rRNA (guanine(527)-N(7))-methyltransferase RsmG [Rhodospirillales bacterium]
MQGIQYPVEDTVMERVDVYIRMLEKWQKAINLVGPKTLADPWRRHILDSAQLIPEIINKKINKPVIADLGSGAGLPGLIIAIMTGLPVHLVESDQRKCTFLRETARETATTVTVHTGRIEEIAPINADIVTARALAPMLKLLPWVNRHLIKSGFSLLLKGADVDEELTICAKQWTMNIERKRSLSDDSGTVLILDQLTPITED